jgi:hypothetical protein
MRNRRQHKIDVALAEALQEADPYLLPREELAADTGRKVSPRPTDTELGDALAYHDGAHRLTSVPGETGPRYKLNPAGHAWLAEQR